MTAHHGHKAMLDSIAFTRSLRKDGPDAKRVLWQLLRGHYLKGLRFRRQHEFGLYILDFYCHEIHPAMEAVEVGTSRMTTPLPREESVTALLETKVSLMATQ
jgi:hypothetical protein